MKNSSKLSGRSRQMFKVLTFWNTFFIMFRTIINSPKLLKRTFGSTESRRWAIIYCTYLWTVDFSLVLVSPSWDFREFFSSLESNPRGGFINRLNWFCKCTVRILETIKFQWIFVMESSKSYIKYNWNVDDVFLSQDLIS